MNEDNKYHYVYILTHIETNEFYIGSRTCKCNVNDDPYMGSMVSWKPDKSKLKKVIIKSDFADRESALLCEATLIKETISDSLNRNYNIPGVGFCNQGRVLTESQIKKLRDSHLGKILPESQRKKMGESRKGRIVTVETRAKISAKLTGIHHSDEFKKKISESNLIRFKDKNNHPFYNKHLSADHIQKIRLSKSHTMKAVVQYSVTGDIIQEYESIRCAARTTGVDRATLRSVCNGKYKMAGGYLWKYK